MGSVEVSVVVPVRNGAPYFDNFVGFMKSQTNQDFELIFIVDGSSEDDTVELAKIASEKFDNSTVIVQNEGYKLSGNRNLGLKAAKADTVWFVDIDDAPSKDFIKDMLNLQKKYDADFVCCNFMNVGPAGLLNEKPGVEYHSKFMNHDETVISRINDEFPVSAWSKLFKRSFLLNNDLFFVESFAEDVVHTYRCVNVCERVCIYSRPLIAYRQTPNSICRSKGNVDGRGKAEIAAYDFADTLFEGNLEMLKRNALMKIRSSGHMSYHGFMEFTKSDKNRDSYNKYLKGTVEGWWNLHLSSLYWLAIRTYVATIYKRNGTLAVNKKFWE